MLRQMILFIALVSITSSDLQIRELEDIPEKYKDQEGCYVADLDEVIPFGQSVGKAPLSNDFTKCVQYRCQESSVIIARCSPATGNTVAHPNQPYPDCCPQPVRSEAVNA